MESPSRATPSFPGALLWLGCLQFFVCEQLARLGWQGHYSLRSNYISDLGTLGCAATCSHLHALMNASFAIQGVLIAGGALLLRRSLLPGVWGGLAFTLLLLSALGVSMLAYAPSDVDAMLCAAPALWRSRRGRSASTRPTARAAFFFGAVATLGDLLLVLGGPAQATLGVGTLERFAAYPLPLWLALTGALALRTRNRPHPQSLAGDLE